MSKTVYFNLCGEEICLYVNDNLYHREYTWSSKRHSHAYYEAHMILEGSCSVKVGKETYELQANQALLIAPDQFHFPIALSGDFERFSVSFSVGEGELLYALQNEVPTSKVYSVSREMRELCHGIFYESAAANPFQQDMIRILLMQLLIRNFRGLHLNDFIQAEFVPMSDGERLNLIDTFFEMHVADNSTADALAKQLHLSRRQLNRILYRYYGVGFREKMIRSRMDMAAWLLESTEKQVCEVAGELGYDSESSFYQMFRSRYGMSPIQYRMSIKKKKSDQ